MDNVKHLVNDNYLELELKLERRSQKSHENGGGNTGYKGNQIQSQGLFGVETKRRWLL